MSDPMEAVRSRLGDPSARALADAVVRATRDGDLPAGTLLPPIRTVARTLMMSPTTVSSAWTMLRRTGTISTDGRRGSVIARRPAAFGTRYKQALDHHFPVEIDLSTGMPDHRLLPDVHRALAAIPAHADQASYLDNPVLPELRDVLGGDWPYPIDGFAVVDGALDALDLVARATIEPGARVIVENPGYPLITELLEAVGARLVGVPLDDEGMRPDVLARALAEPVSAVVMQPRAQNPYGATMSEQRRDELAALLAPTGALVVEDDSAGAVASTPLVGLGGLLPERTVHIRSFAKSHGPDLRLAAMSGPAGLLDEIAARRRLGQGWTSRLLQRVLCAMLTDPGTVRQVRDARATYQQRRSWLATELAARGVRVPGTDGINLWLPVVDEAATVARLASRGIGVAYGTPFTTGRGVGPAVRVTCGLLAPDERVADELAAAARLQRRVRW
jgi:DNA-binding transcriptional MocR family regulator